MPPGASMPELWLLGSSDFSAQLAAQRGLGFAFAHHINQDLAIPAHCAFIANIFKPSQYQTEPRAILAVSVICAETDEEAARLAQPANLVWLRFQRGNFREPLPSLEDAENYPYTEAEREFLQATRRRMFVGSPETVRRELGALAETAGADEIMVTTFIHEHAARRRSYELLARAFEI